MINSDAPVPNEDTKDLQRYVVSKNTVMLAFHTKNVTECMLAELGVWAVHYVSVHVLFMHKSSSTLKLHNYFKLSMLWLFDS